jgi:hypothetical protein
LAHLPPGKNAKVRSFVTVPGFVVKPQRLCFSATAEEKLALREGSRLGIRQLLLPRDSHSPERLLTTFRQEPMPLESSMNRLAIAASMIAVSVSKAAAADLPTQLQTKAPLMAPGFRWSGFYIGGNGQGLLTSDASARDALTGLPFHRAITHGGSGNFTTVSAGHHNKAAYRRRAGQSGFRQSAKSVFIGTGPEQGRAAERKGAIAILAGGPRSDRLAA